MKKLLHIILSLVIIVSSTQNAFANASGWVSQSVFMSGATATINAIKGSGSSALQSVITHKPTAMNVGKNIIGGGGAVAVAYAMSQLLDAGIDWVMDPANNRVNMLSLALKHLVNIFISLVFMATQNLNFMLLMI